ncbi:MAG: hypothetical protein ACI9Y7_001225 [Dokdonia sp.]|jgi:hypothetical protein
MYAILAESAFAKCQPRELSLSFVVARLLALVNKIKGNFEHVLECKEIQSIVFRVKRTPNIRVIKLKYGLYYFW